MSRRSATRGPRTLLNDYRRTSRLHADPGKHDKNEQALVTGLDVHDGVATHASRLSKQVVVDFARVWHDGYDDDLVGVLLCPDYPYGLGAVSEY